MFNNYDLTDKDIMDIVGKYEGLINRYSEINGRSDDDLKQFIVMEIYKKLTKNREK
ncbi:MAG: helix-turn-helix domain-containing protein [Clostridia bacterium]|nr:helix-turn-helix domain-containing protein [Clostridia bacterium]